MKKEQIYSKLYEIKSTIRHLQRMMKLHHVGAIESNDKINKLATYAQVVMAYITANKDMDMAIDCCKINREQLYHASKYMQELKKKHKIEVDKSLHSINHAAQILFDIQTYTIEEFFLPAHPELTDRDPMHYYINTETGKCSSLDNNIIIEPAPENKACKELIKDEFKPIIKKGKPGRSKEPKDLWINVEDKQTIKDRLHKRLESLPNGTKTYDVVKILYQEYEKGIIIRPVFRIFHEEFPKIKMSRESFSKNWRKLEGIFE